MSRVSDNLFSGRELATSAASSVAPVVLTKTYRILGGANRTVTGVFPSGTQNLDAKVLIIQDGSAATSDTLTISTSAGATTLGTVTSFGSAGGFIGGNSTTSVGTLTMIASACANIGPSTLDVEVPFQLLLSSTDAACDYQVQLIFNRQGSGVNPI